MESGFASNGYGDRSPGGYGLLAALIAEIVLTAIFLYIILGATDDRAPKGFAPIAIGLGLTLIHLVSIPVTNTSVNPARSLGVAWFAGGAALAQVWLFIVAPIIGAAIAGISYAAITGANRRRGRRGHRQQPLTGTQVARRAPDQPILAPVVVFRLARGRCRLDWLGLAGMVELVDTQDLGSCAFGCEGSSPSSALCPIARSAREELRSDRPVSSRARERKACSLAQSSRQDGPPDSWLNHHAPALAGASSRSASRPQSGA